MSDERFFMTYALGYVTNFDNGNLSRIDLGELLAEWEGYTLEGYRSGNTDLNDRYSVWYSGPFGKEDSEEDQDPSCCLGTVYRGFGIGHTVHLLNQLIEVHKAERNYWKKYQE